MVRPIVSEPITAHHSTSYGNNNSQDTIGVDTLEIPTAVVSVGNYIRQQEGDNELNIINTRKIGGGYSSSFLFHFTYNTGETDFSSFRSWGIYGYWGSDEDFNNTQYQLLYSSKGPEPLTRTLKFFAGLCLCSLPATALVPPLKGIHIAVSWILYVIGGGSAIADWLGVGPLQVGYKWVNESSQEWDADNPGILPIPNF